MERSGDGRILVVADTSFLVNFLCIDRMDILRGLRDYAFRVPNHVVAEVTCPAQRTRLDAALSRGAVEQLEITDLDEIALYDELRRGGRLGDGETACLAVAARRRRVIAADERGRLRREILGRLGEDYLLDTPGALLAALRVGVVTAAEARAIREELARNRFVMRDVPLLEELLRGDL